MSSCKQYAGLLIAIALLAAAPSRAWGWLAAGHDRMTRAAAAALPDTVPAFFRQGTEVLAGTSLDPDTFRGAQMQALTVEEAPEHFFDVEMVHGQIVPPNRYLMLQLCQHLKIDPYRLGMLPYAITEWTQKLAVAFAQQRRWPEDAGIQARCLVYGGILAHYAEDLTQPLHVTIHFDGRADSSGHSPHSGIHMRVDALPGRLELTNADAPVGDTVHAYDSILTSVIEEMHRSNALVDKVYSLENDLPPPQEVPWTPSPAVHDFGVERFRAAARFTASLWLTAWEMSAHVNIPDWVAPRAQDRGAGGGN